MAAQTKKQRSEAAKKAAATRKRNEGKTDGASVPGRDPAAADSPVHPTTSPGEKVDGKDVAKLDRGLDDFKIEQLDGAYAVLRLGNVTRLVAQADLHFAAKEIARGVQLTY